MRKAQIEFSLLILIVTVAALIMLAPIMYKIVNMILLSFQTGSQGVITQQGNQTITTSLTLFNNFWDFMILAGIVSLILLLIATSWFVNTNVVFLVFYIIFAFVMVIFAGNFQSLLQSVFYTPDFFTGNLPYTRWIIDNWMTFTMLLIIISIVIIFAKARSAIKQA